MRWRFLHSSLTLEFKAIRKIFTHKILTQNIDFEMEREKSFHECKCSRHLCNSTTKICRRESICQERISWQFFHPFSSFKNLKLIYFKCDVNHDVKEFNLRLVPPTLERKTEMTAFIIHFFSFNSDVTKLDVSVRLMTMRFTCGWSFFSWCSIVDFAASVERKRKEVFHF